MKSSKIKRTAGQGLVSESHARSNSVGQTGSAGHVSTSPRNRMAAGRPDSKTPEISGGGPSPGRGQPRRDLRTTIESGSRAELPKRAQPANPKYPETPGNRH